jgi:hypothetical protein
LKKNLGDSHFFQMKARGRIPAVFIIGNNFYRRVFTFGMKISITRGKNSQKN